MVDTLRTLNILLDIKPESILYETDFQQVGHDLHRCALGLAVLGEVDAARGLLSVAFKSGLHINRNYTRALNWAWKETSNWPEGIAEEEKTEEVFQRERESYEKCDWGDVSERDHRFDEIGLKTCLEPRWKEVSGCSVGSPPIEKSARVVKALDILVRLS